MKWIWRVLAALVVIYVALFGTVAFAMMQTPERFGAFMKRMPAAVVWGGLPAKRILPKVMASWGCRATVMVSIERSARQRRGGRTKEAR